MQKLIFHDNEMAKDFVYSLTLHVALYITQLLTHRRFYCVEKIKTVGQTYMCASGLTHRTNFTDMTHILALADYTFALQNQLQYINENSFNNFIIRIGKLLPFFQSRYMAEDIVNNNSFSIVI